ncbi:PQQ-binding-like beta-propeller repeat protein [Palaeococcus ferrophilus]|uniref:PQQ-binding-like beta-propeller repeat protein n=1 Tax=Palaeococcus ferrophilus TaxID=83868 RepID=UPI0006985254|nr:PQQ-binding-like beta-propeller repeat protein [Palaeococcus ferrophilus]
MRMKKTVVIITFLLMASLLASGSQSPIIWEVKVPGTVESVRLTPEGAYVGFGHIDNIKGVIWYRGNVSFYTLNGSEEWTQEVGFVRKLEPLDGRLIVGTDISRGPEDWFGALGKVWLLKENGSIMSGNITYGSFFDFDLKDSLYVVDGWWIGEGRANETWGRLYRWEITGEGIKEDWFLELNGTLGRVRKGDRIVYVGSGAPSGYRMKYYFGNVYGVSEDGKLLWSVDTKWWVRDLELWRNRALVGTGFENVAGKLFLINSEGNVEWEGDSFYVEDIEINGDTAYIGGVEGDTGKLEALDLNSKEVLWEANFPYRVKVVKFHEGKLLVGTGAFKQENGTTYDMGLFYVVDPTNGKVLMELDTGYVRSLDALGDEVLVGTGRGRVYLINLDAKDRERAYVYIGVGIILVVLAGIVGKVGRKKA